MSVPYSVGMALGHLGTIDPHAAKTSRAALRPLFPDTATMSVGEFGVFLNQIPLRDVAAKLCPDGAGWLPAVESDLIVRGFDSHTHLKLYPRDIRRLVNLGETLEVRVPQIELLPGWQALLDLLAGIVPKTVDQVACYQAAGVKFVGIYDIAGLTLVQASKKAQMLHYSVGVLARKASAAGLTPTEFGREILRGERLKEVADFTPPSTYHYYAKNAWNALGNQYPELGLSIWPDRARRTGIRSDQLPPELAEGTEAGFFDKARCDQLEKNSIKTHRTTVAGYYGTLIEEGIQLTFTVGLASKDAFRILWQSLPREVLVGDPEKDAPRAIAERIMRDAIFREEVLVLMRAMEGSYEGREAIKNPFVEMALDARLEAGQCSAARNLVLRAREANRDHLQIRGRHLAWIEGEDVRLKNLVQRAKTAGKSKKKLVFRNPKLWKHLIKRLDVMIQHVERLTRGTARWATTLRNLVFIYMLLLIPMRINAYLYMELGHHFNPQTGEIHFDEDEVKNDVEINYQLPEKGIHARLRDLITLYLEVARPLLLQGAASPYMFVPDRSVPNAGIHVREKGFNEILKDLSERYFREVLPVGLGWLNPHLARHIVASYQIQVKKAPIRAAQLLGDKLETVLKYYSDILESASEDIKDYYETMDDDDPADDE